MLAGPTAHTGSESAGNLEIPHRQRGMLVHETEMGALFRIESDVACA